ncbi:unnamed protein product [Protopolystoma xenopodis]|uniref:Uncharacterized protein n=1 Tax=Protopolystoma xenopodis TaxID=117903 RepID=A0A448XIT0_9PLAT|nr:unnamed protein product [Protopolystoma xenopodis]
MPKCTQALRSQTFALITATRTGAIPPAWTFIVSPASASLSVLFPLSCLQVCNDTRASHGVVLWQMQHSPPIHARMWTHFLCPKCTPASMYTLLCLLVVVRPQGLAENRVFVCVCVCVFVHKELGLEGIRGGKINIEWTRRGKKHAN